MYCPISEFMVPKSVVAIPPYAFCRDSNLSSIKLHNDIKEIGESAFAKTSIKSIEWPEKCSVVPDSCFLSCCCLSTISLPDTVTTVSDNAFFGTNIDNFRWPTNCKAIPASCFYSSKIKKIFNIDRVEKICSHAFSKCSNLELVDLSSSVSLVVDIAPNAFLESPNCKLIPSYYSQIRG